jgi:hypothetical protein
MDAAGGISRGVRAELLLDKFLFAAHGGFPFFGTLLRNQVMLNRQKKRREMFRKAQHDRIPLGVAANRLVT